MRALEADTQGGKLPLYTDKLTKLGGSLVRTRLAQSAQDFGGWTILSRVALKGITRFSHRLVTCPAESSKNPAPSFASILVRLIQRLTLFPLSA